MKTKRESFFVYIVGIFYGLFTSGLIYFYFSSLQEHLYMWPSVALMKYRGVFFCRPQCICELSRQLREENVEVKKKRIFFFRLYISRGADIAVRLTNAMETVC